MRRILVPMMTLLVAGGSAFGVRAWIDAQRHPAAAGMEPADPKERKAVLVAAKNLAAGAFVQPDGIRWQEWPNVDTPGLTHEIRSLNPGGLIG